MSFLRFLMLLSLVVWIGGLIFFAFVLAPTAFQVLPNTHLAGNVVGRALGKLHWIAIFSGIVFLICFAALQPRHEGTRALVRGRGTSCIWPDARRSRCSRSSGSFRAWTHCGIGQRLRDGAARQSRAHAIRRIARVVHARGRSSAVVGTGGGLFDSECFREEVKMVQFSVVGSQFSSSRSRL